MNDDQKTSSCQPAAEGTFVQYMLSRSLLILIPLRDDRYNDARLALRAKTKKRAVVDQLCPIYVLWTSPTPTPTPGPIERHIKCFLLAICTSPALHIIVIAIVIVIVIVTLSTTTM